MKIFIVYAVSIVFISCDHELFTWICGSGVACSPGTHSPDATDEEEKVQIITQNQNKRSVVHWLCHEDTFVLFDNYSVFAHSLFSHQSLEVFNESGPQLHGTPYRGSITSLSLFTSTNTGDHTSYVQNWIPAYYLLNTVFCLLLFKNSEQ